MQVGDYVRTKYGIAKIVDIGEITRICLSSDITYQDKEYILDVSIFPNYDANCNYCYDYDITKSSPEIIKLIQQGDYVNGRKVEWVGDDFVAFGKLDYAYKKDIKSIVTREQFLQMEYKIESEVN